MSDWLENRELVASACKQIYKGGLVKLGEGNISSRIPSKDEMIITPAGTDYDNPLAEHMVHVGFDGTNFDMGDGLVPSSEFFLHRHIYQHRIGVNAIIHAHSPYVSVLAINHQDLPVIFEEMGVVFGGPVKCSKFATAGTEDLPKMALNAMGKYNCCILANHGSVVTGKSMDYCIHAVMILEKMAKIYVHAKVIGTPIEIPKEKYQPFAEIFIKKYSIKN